MKPDQLDHAPSRRF